MVAGISDKGHDAAPAVLRAKNAAARLLGIIAPDLRPHVDQLPVVRPGAQGFIEAAGVPPLGVDKHLLDGAEPKVFEPLGCVGASAGCINHQIGGQVTLVVLVVGGTGDDASHLAFLGGQPLYPHPGFNLHIGQSADPCADMGFQQGATDQQHAQFGRETRLPPVGGQTTAVIDVVDHDGAVGDDFVDDARERLLQQIPAFGQDGVDVCRLWHACAHVQRCSDFVALQDGDVSTMAGNGACCQHARDAAADHNGLANLL